jgi:hypothetical protein
MRLDDLARRLAVDDPELAEAMRDGWLPPDPPRRAVVGGTAGGFCVLVLLAALFGGVAGVVTLIITVVIPFLSWRVVRRRRHRPRG